MTKRLEIWERSEVRDFGDTVAEVVLLGIFAHVVEGQDDDGGFVGERKRRRRSSGARGKG